MGGVATSASPLRATERLTHAIEEFVRDKEFSVATGFSKASVMTEFSLSR